MSEKLNVDHLRKMASSIWNQSAFEELTSIPQREWSFNDELAEMKLASIEDPELLKIAASLHDDCVIASDGLVTSTTDTIHEVLQDYEDFGGKYKHGFGAPIFNSQQMSGSPAVSGGMGARARTPVPQIQKSPVSVTTTTIGQKQQNQQDSNSTITSSGSAEPSVTMG